MANEADGDACTCIGQTWSNLDLQCEREQRMNDGLSGMASLYMSR